MTEVAYNRGKYRIASGATNGLTSDLRMLLIVGDDLPAGWSDPDLDTVADLDAVTGLDIHTERVALTSLTVTQDDTNDRANLDSALVEFAAASGVRAWAGVIYDHAAGASDADRHLICGSSTGFTVDGLPMDGGLEVPIADWARLT
jgi:hypothetical protein